MLNENLTIIEYDPKYAKSIAEMWNNSGEGWNGDNSHHTEAGVIDKEATSTHLNLYLALIGDKVVGYCKLSKYYFDENTLYIDLLNVEPQYFNRKIGKALVKLAVERTMELGYPRLDLFTWAGNTKAVPLYKKCGFFWEKMEANSTHLMNFIPTVMQTPLLKGYFDYLDWYDDSTRPIIVEADGRTEHNFDFLTYIWEKDGTKLIVEFEKNGRGIHSIDTDEFTIVTEIANGKLVFGQKYKVIYLFTNKTDKAQQVEIKGINDKNIRFNLSKSSEIVGSQTIEGEFYLDPKDMEQSMWKTHPCVCAEISVNGKTAVFKTGINPQFPLRMFAGRKETLLYAGREKELFINVENNFDEDCSFEISFPAQKDIRFADDKVEIALQAYERNSFPIRISVSNSLVYYQRVTVKASFSNGQELLFSQPFTMTNYLSEGRAWGENDKHRSIINGMNLLIMDKDDDINEIIFRHLSNNLFWYHGYPKLGKPYSSEFQYKLPDKTEYLEEADSLTMKAYFSSGAFPGCSFISYYKLYNSGMLEHFTELLSFPFGSDEISISRSFGLDSRQMAIPYAGMIIQTDDVLHNDSMISNWGGDKIDENWLYCNGKSGNMSLVWHKEDKLLCCDWNYAIETSFRKGESTRSNSLYVAFDVFSSIKKLREFALGKEVEAVIPNSFYNLQVNDGNPFWGVKPGLPAVPEIGKTCPLTYLDYRQPPLECTVTVSSLNSEGSALSATASKDKELHQLNFGYDAKGSALIDIVSAKASYPTKDFCVDKALFRKQTAEVLESVEQVGENTVYSIDNGIICFRVSPEFAPSVYSLVYDKHEWLDNSFPERGSKSWWNPWCGGAESILDNIKRACWLSEKHHVAFVQKQDNFAQLWRGIEIRTKIENYDSLKDISICQYYLVLPGLPLVANYCTYQQDKGFYRDLSGFSRVFVKGDEDIRDCTFELTVDDRVLSTQCGMEEIDFEVISKLLACSGKQRKEKLYFYSAQADIKAYASSDPGVTSLLFYHRVTLQNCEGKTTPIKYIILSELNLSEKSLIDLDNICFE
jgi:GNAT superfamily N-acetyltransferase